MIKHSIRTNILTIFLILIGLISFSLLTTQYYFNQQLIANSTNKTFQIITKNISAHIQKSNQRIKNLLLSNKDDRNLYQDIKLGKNHQAFKEFIKIIQIYKGIDSIYLANKNGAFYQVVEMGESEILYNFYKAPKKTKWTVVTCLKGKTTYLFLNKNSIQLSSRDIDKEYNPLQREWYKQAIHSKKEIMTESYIFADNDMYGITYALELEKRGTVLAIDFTLNTLNTFLKLQKYEENSEIFLFNNNEEKVASSNWIKNNLRPDDISIVHPLKEAFLKHNTKVVKYTIQQDSYFASYAPTEYKNIFLGIKLNTKNLLNPYERYMKYSLYIALILLLASLPIIFFATTLIIKPIRALIKENEKIKVREFTKVRRIETNIIEFIELSDSFVLMSNSIQEYQKAQEQLLNAIVKLIAEAVDAKSAYTGGHCERVPQIAQLLIKEASNSTHSIFKDFSLKSKDELREFEIGAWLHDCGKVTTPEYVVDKSTKLETINDRIHEIRTRFEVLWRDAQIEYLQARLRGEDEKSVLLTMKTTQNILLEEFSFIANANIGGEYMSPEKQARIKEIANREWQRNFDDSLGLGEVEILRYDRDNEQTLPATEKLLSDKKQHIIKRENFDYASYKSHGFKEEIPKNLYNYGEIYNLCIAKGTLNTEERYKINEHVILTIKMLEKIPFPSHMTKIPEYAGTHHETLIGTGYPRKLTKKDLSIPARIMALADVFEALTASDRPYKKAKTLSESIKILSFMVKDEHLDADIFKLFLKSDLHNVYAKKYLEPEQIDKVDIEQYL